MQGAVVRGVVYSKGRDAADKAVEIERLLYVFSDVLAAMSTP